MPSRNRVLDLYVRTVLARAGNAPFARRGPLAAVVIAAGLAGAALRHAVRGDAAGSVVFGLTMAAAAALVAVFGFRWPRVGRHGAERGSGADLPAAEARREPGPPVGAGSHLGDAPAPTTALARRGSTQGREVRAPESPTDALVRSLFVMASFVEARDPYTGGHLWRVSQFSGLLASEVGLAPMDIARVTLGGFLHDLGKVGIPDAILNKAGPLTEDETAVMRTHPEVGARLLGGHPLADLARPAVLGHHERPDGRGYPHGLRGHALPLDARIVGVCDAFDAMTSTRPYRKGMPVERALDLLEAELGRQFDGELGARLVELGRRGRLDPIVGHSDRGIPVQRCPICGPTIVIRRDMVEGEPVWCPPCGNEAIVVRDAGGLHARPTGRRGDAHDRAHVPDLALIAELSRAASAVLASARTEAGA